MLQGFLESIRPNLFHFVPVLLGTGICIYFNLDNEPSLIFSAGMFIFSLIIAYFRREFLAITIVGFGFLLAQLRTISVNTPLLQNPLEKTVIFADIESCEKTEKGMSFIVKNVDFGHKKFGSDNQFEALQKIQLTWRGKKAESCSQEYAPGDRVNIFTTLQPLNNQPFPECYDFKKQQYFNHISARGFILSQPKIVKKREINPEMPFIQRTQERFLMWFDQLRHAINLKIEANLDSDAASIAKAITTGTKAAISQEMRDNFVKSGTAHILAISGLHIGIIGLFIFELIRLLLCSFCNIKKAAAIISLLGAIFYFFLSGTSVSAFRALIMHSLIILAIILDRTALTMRSVAVAALVILLIMPEVIMFPSFQLSFSAVMAIVAFYEKCGDFSPRFRMFFNIICTTIVASLATAIFSVFVFHQLTLNSIFANIFTIPLMTFFIMPAAIFSLIFLIFDVVFPLKILAFGITGLIKLVTFSAGLPGSLFVMSAPSNLTLAIIIYSALIFILINHSIRLTGLYGIFFGLILYAFEEVPRVIITPHAKSFGVKINSDLVCFNHCGYFRNITSAWTKSVGCENRENFKSKSCKKCIEQLDEDSYVAKIDGTRYILTYDENRLSKSQDKSGEENSTRPKIIFLDENDQFTREIYLPSLKESSNRRKNRPWNSATAEK